MFQNVTSALIAGGKSRRFGSSKLMAKYNGQRLLDRALNIAMTISKDTIIIGDLDPSIKVEAVPVYKDIVSGCGPVCGIYTALFHAQKKYVAVLPVDMPLLSPDVYRFLYPSLTEERPVVALSPKGLEPLVSIWPVALREEFEKAIENKEYKLYKLLQKFNAKEIDLESLMPSFQDSWFKNINYKEDLEHIKSMEVESDLISMS
jgi:molybdopterin-guanine dinucleotide biosynthesis protein A